MIRVVLVNPEIPPNTGAIARTCAATDTELHLVEPLGFEISDRYLKRAGLDYWPYVKLTRHPNWASFVTSAAAAGGRLLGFSTRGNLDYWDCQFQPGDWLLFGRETAGLSPQMLAQCDGCLRIPMTQPQVRSLNLSVSAALGLFEARRQLIHRPALQARGNF
ncbi:tRNA (cytidine(34)-2'-O)-methyltransferase [Lyngbya confervoides]|uniref:Putative tRNA (cytidine(34)-2'-O)-methyltransferase n=1 Tax=Lyngbya confervoides BDU141951 TaxID=1574623 RepID=A0ABD4T639_9CYAN|nr:tRNA (cytidine(34)-2'-O)-methyltransferase [Lyngbya confervoides]MCM1984197.1 tRNA (cytidine(34)-2'-O)-methyltransferase [Lyngbya confervoides BDU141951]